MNESLQFFNGDEAIVHSTGSYTMDGMRVRVIGLAHDFRPAKGSVYIVEGSEQIDGWDAVCMTESCLSPV